MIFGKKKKGFTLVEMLIVIVIIGVLAAALIPRLISVRGRANDVARKADLQQIATAIVSYSMDKGYYPTTTGSVAGLSGALQNYITVLPTDMSLDSTFSEYSSAGNYAYLTIKRGGTADAGFMLMAKVETEGGANWIYFGTVGIITGGTDSQNIIPCTTMTKTGSTGTPSILNGTCIYPNDNQLRYIIAR